MAKGVGYYFCYPMKKIVIISAISAALCLTALFLLRPAVEAQEQAPDFTSQVIAKLDQVIKGQKEIVFQLADIKKELDVIRVRASRK